MILHYCRLLCTAPLLVTYLLRRIMFLPDRMGVNMSPHLPTATTAIPPLAQSGQMLRVSICSIRTAAWSTLLQQIRNQGSYYSFPALSIPTSIAFHRRAGLSLPGTATLRLNLREMSSTAEIRDRYKLVFFVPPSDLEVCKEAIFATGAGSFPGGKYTKCCFQTHGTGQFLPNEGANPAIGKVGAVEQCEEVKVEIMCLGRQIMRNAVQALIKAHPYEEVAYEVYRMENE